MLIKHFQDTFFDEFLGLVFLISNQHFKLFSLLSFEGRIYTGNCYEWFWSMKFYNVGFDFLPKAAF